MGIELIKVPDVGSSDPVDVIEVTVNAGDVLNEDDTLVVLESDKATIEVPAPLAGKVHQLKIKVGDRVKEGDPLIEIETTTQTSSETVAENQSEDQSKPVPSEGQSADAKQPTNNEKPEQAIIKSASKELIVHVPDLGDIESAELIEISVSDGDQVAEEDVLAVLESDKTSLEIPSPTEGVVSSITAQVGAALSSGDPLLVLTVQAKDESESTADLPDVIEHSADSVSLKKSRLDSKKEDVIASPSESSAEPDRSDAAVHAGPAVRKLARELGVSLAGITGTGPKGRLLKEDVHAHVKKRLSESSSSSSVNTMSSGLPELPEVDVSKFGEIERIELNKLRKASANNLHRAWLTIPHVTQHDEADISSLEAFRKNENMALQRQDVKLTMLAFLVKASASALQAFPHFNSSLATSGDVLIQKKFINIGVAVDTPNGLVVPVIRDADKKGLIDIATEMSSLAEKARDRKLMPQDMQGGTFSISSLGGIGGTAFTPIVNWPEVAILGVSRSQMKPIWDGEAFQPKLMLPLSLSYDHRVIDGADAARFITYLSRSLADFRRVLL